MIRKQTQVSGKLREADHGVQELVERAMYFLPFPMETCSSILEPGKDHQ